MTHSTVACVLGALLAACASGAAQPRVDEPAPGASADAWIDIVGRSWDEAPVRAVVDAFDMRWDGGSAYVPGSFDNRQSLWVPVQMYMSDGARSRVSSVVIGRTYTGALPFGLDMHADIAASKEVVTRRRDVYSVDIEQRPEHLLVFKHRRGIGPIQVSVKPGVIVRLDARLKPPTRPQRANTASLHAGMKTIRALGGATTSAWDEAIVWGLHANGEASLRVGGTAYRLIPKSTKALPGATEHLYRVNLGQGDIGYKWVTIRAYRDLRRLEGGYRYSHWIRVQDFHDRDAEAADDYFARWARPAPNAPHMNRATSPPEAVRGFLTALISNGASSWEVQSYLSPAALAREGLEDAPLDVPGAPWQFEVEYAEGSKVQAVVYTDPKEERACQLYTFEVVREADRWYLKPRVTGVMSRYISPWVDFEPKAGDYVPGSARER